MVSKAWIYGYARITKEVQEETMIELETKLALEMIETRLKVLEKKLSSYTKGINLLLKIIMDRIERLEEIS